MKRLLSPPIQRLLAPLALISIGGFALGCGVIDRMSGVADAKDLQGAGIPAEAEILSHWDTGITVNGDPVIGLKLQVRPKDGAPYEALIKKSLVSRLDLSQFQPGSVIPVRIDPKDPSRVAIDVYKYR
ncbi:MAG TPA: hypothetical protein VHR45_20055 [Thermoanaerobaculia bacterium]|nr:hypothetical protein [Thermoanaerobaculia bacterium]